MRPTSGKTTAAAPQWPNTITSRHHHLRRRAEAYASALYYSECSMNGVSADGAAAAEEDARSRQSRWWLKGNDPNHPSLKSPLVAEATIASPSDVGVVDKNPKPNETLELAGGNDHDEGEDNTDDENDSIAANNIQEDYHDDTLVEDDSNVPILARDDDLGTSFGTLSAFNTSRPSTASSSYPGITTDNVAVHVVPTPSTMLPPWLTSPNSSPDASSAQVLKQDVGSSEEMLNSYSTYPNQFLSREKNQEHPSISKLPLNTAHQVTSGSETDDSIHSSEMSCGNSDDTANPSSRKPKFQGVATSCVPRSRKRARADLSSPLGQTYLDARIKSAKNELLSRLKSEGTSPGFKRSLASLEKYAKLKESSNKKRKSSSAAAAASSSPTTATNNDSADIDGTWLMVSPPEYPSCLGENSEGDSMFTLGRMSFDMYEPSDLVCSIQKQYNTIKSVDPKDLPLYVPKSLRREVDNERRGNCSGRLKTYNIIASFTIEDTAENSSRDAIRAQSKKPLRGIITSYGYALPDPTLSDRKSIWFTGGTIEPADDDSIDEWMKIFGSNSVDIIAKEEASTGHDTNESRSTVEAEKAKTLAFKILLGAVHEPINNQGTVGFHLNKPIGGHGSAYCDIVYMDDELRIMRGHSGSIYVFKRV